MATAAHKAQHLARLLQDIAALPAAVSPELRRLARHIVCALANRREEQHMELMDLVESPDDEMLVFYWRHVHFDISILQENGRLLLSATTRRQNARLKWHHEFADIDIDNADSAALPVERAVDFIVAGFARGDVMK